MVVTVNSRYSGHPRDRDLVSVIARVRNSGVRENFYFKPYLQKGVTCVSIFINSSTFFRTVVASKDRQTLFTNRTELNRTGVTYALCTVVLLNSFCAIFIYCTGYGQSSNWKS